MSAPTPPDNKGPGKEDQLILFSSGPEDGGIDVAGTVGEYTGERLKVRDPKRYELIMRLLAEGVGMLRIAKLVGSSPHTVKAIRDAEGLAISDEKKRISGGLRDFARMGVERLIEEIGDIPIGQMPVAVAVAIDKMQILDGEPNRILGEAKKVASIDDFNAFVDALPSANGMGFGGGERGAKEGDVGGVEGDLGMATDSGSVGDGV